jgi:signal transduction histidine kinase
LENRVSSAALYDLLNASSNGFLVFTSPEFTAGEGLNCTFANSAAINLTGVQDLNGMAYGDIFDPTIGFHANSIYAETLKVRFRNSGKYCNVDFSGDSNGYKLCTIREIDTSVPVLRYPKQKLWEDAEEVMQFGGWIWDVEQQGMEWTDGLYKLLDLNPRFSSAQQDELALFARYVHPQDVDVFLRQLARIATYTDVYVFEFRIISAAGHEKLLYLRGENIIDDQTGHTVSVATIFNVSMLRLMQRDLEQKVSDLNTSNTDLEQFAYIASHDLQEPLRKIVSFGERLDHKSKDIFSEEQQLYLDRILNATRRMQEMINNLLEFSRVSGASKVYVSADLDEILRNTLSDLEVNIQEKGALIELGKMPVMEVIPGQISQLFLNLISNSLKFTMPGVTPLIKIHCTNLEPEQVASRKLNPDKQYVCIEFQDNGIGFETGSAEKIFTIFQRLRGRSEFEGAGIGLAVCKKVVERHHGTIEAFGVPGEGATFEVILPRFQTS